MKVSQKNFSLKVVACIEVDKVVSFPTDYFESIDLIVIFNVFFSIKKSIEKKFRKCDNEVKGMKIVL